MVKKPKGKESSTSKDAERITLFKVIYQVEFESCLETRNVAGVAKRAPHSNIRISRILNERISDVLDAYTVDHDLDYLDKHLPAEVQEIVAWLYFKEAPTHSEFAGFSDRTRLQSRRKKERERIVKNMTKQRLSSSLQIGAPRKSDKPGYREERSAFQQLFVESVWLRMEKGETDPRPSSIASMMGAKIKNNTAPMPGVPAYAEWIKWADDSDRHRGTKMKSKAKTLSFDYDKLLADAKRTKTKINLAAKKT